MAKCRFLPLFIYKTYQSLTRQPALSDFLSFTHIRCTVVTRFASLAILSIISDSERAAGFAVNRNEISLAAILPRIHLLVVGKRSQIKVMHLLTRSAVIEKKKNVQLSQMLWVIRFAGGWTAAYFVSAFWFDHWNKIQNWRISIFCSFCPEMTECQH